MDTAAHIDPAGHWAHHLATLAVSTTTVDGDRIDVDRTSPRLDAVTWYMRPGIDGSAWSWAEWQAEYEAATGRKATILVGDDGDEIGMYSRGTGDERTVTMARHADATVGKMVALFCR